MKTCVVFPHHVSSPVVTLRCCDLIRLQFVFGLLKISWGPVFVGQEN